MKRIVFIIAVLLLIGSNKAKSTTWEEFLNETGGTIWQLQNPPAETNLMLGFFKKEDGSNSFIKSEGDMGTGQISQSRGKYKLSGKDLILTYADGSVVTYTLVFINSNKIDLVSNGITFHYARSNSAEDTWNRSAPINTPSYNGGSSGYVACYTCLGTGSCKVCGGSGIYSNYGNSTPCSACYGTGKCWHCHGSGQQ